MKTLDSHCFLVFLVLLTCVACGPGNLLESSSPPLGLPFDLNGTWVGTWTDSGGMSGNFSSDLSQDTLTHGGGAPVHVSGMASWEDSPCTTQLIVSAGLNPGGFVSPPTLSGVFFSGEIRIEFLMFVSIEADSFGGTYEVVSGPCAGETGSLQASLVVPSQSDPGEQPQPDPIHVVLIDYDANGSVTRVRRLSGFAPANARGVAGTHGNAHARLPSQ